MGYGPFDGSLPVGTGFYNRRFNVLFVVDGRLFFFARSCRGDIGFSGHLMPAEHLLCCLRLPPCASAIRVNPMALGCCVGCAGKNRATQQEQRPLADYTLPVRGTDAATECRHACMDG